MAQIFSSKPTESDILSFESISSVYTELDETIANKMILIGNDVRFIRLPHTKFLDGAKVNFGILNYTNAEDNRQVTLLPHWGEKVENDITATMQLILMETGVEIIADFSDNSWWVLQGKFSQFGADVSSSSEFQTSSTSNSSESSALSKSTSSSTELFSTSSTESTQSSSPSSLNSFTSSSSTINQPTSSSSSTLISLTSSSDSSSSTFVQSTSSSSVEFSSFTSSTSSTSNSSSTELLTSSSTSTSLSSC